MLDTVDFGRNPSGAEFGEYGVLYVRHGKAKKGSPPKRRGVVTVWDWSAEVLQEWLEEVRPLFPTAASSACWPLGTRAVCGLATACSTTRSGGRSTSSGSPTRGSPIMGPFSSEPFALGLEALLLDSGDFDVVFVDDPAMWARDVAVDGSAILIVEGVDPAVCQRYLDERRVHSVVLFDPVGAQAFVGLENPDWQTLVEVLRAAARDVTAEQVHVVDPRALASPCRGETTRSAGRVVRTWQYARWTDGASSSGSAGSTAPRPRATTAACASMRSTRLAVRAQLGQRQPGRGARGRGCGEQGPRFGSQQAAALAGESLEDGGVELAQQRAQLVVRVGPRPDRILLGTGEYCDGLGEFGVRGQRSVRGQVSAQNVG